MSNQEKNILKHYCDKCKGITNHFILYNKNMPSTDPDYSLECKYFMVQCLGCEDLSFRIETHDYEAIYPDDENNWIHDIKIEIYPQPLKNHKILQGLYILPSKIRIVYNETINALKANCYLLTGVGFRAIIEAICIDKQISGRTLEIKINNLTKNRLITEKEAERLHAVRFLGNDSVHEMSVPKEKTLFLVLDIIEHLLQNLYIIDHQAKPLLDTYISNFSEFKVILLKKLENFNKGDDFPLAKYLEKDVRRLNGQLSYFETELIKSIQEGEFKQLEIGDIKNFGTNTQDKFQHFIKND